MARAIKQIATVPAALATPHSAGHPAVLYALCEDGTLWASIPRSGWQKLEPIPDEGSA